MAARLGIGTVSRRALGLAVAAVLVVAMAAPAAGVDRRFQQTGVEPNTAGAGTVQDPADSKGLDIKSATLVDGSPVQFSLETYAPFVDADAAFEWVITTTGPESLFLLLVSPGDNGQLEGVLLGFDSDPNAPPPTVTVTRPTQTSVQVEVQRADLGSPTSIDYVAESFKDANGDQQLQKSEVDLVPDNPKEFIDRIAGSDRIATAIEVSQETFADASQDPDFAAGAVVLARADDYPDALAGTPLAAAQNGPLLLNPTANLDTRVEFEIKRVLPSGNKVFLLGGVSALSQAVADKLTQDGYVVRRLAGNDRFETAVAVAQALGDPNAIFLTTGRAFADALSAGPAAVAKNGVILLTDGSTQPPSVQQYLAGHQGIPRWAVGAPAAAADPTATALVGADRYATNKAVADAFFDAPGEVGVASGESFADALSGGASEARFDSPLLLTRPDALPDPVVAYLSAHREEISLATVFGGPSAVGDAVPHQILDAIHVA